MVKIFKYILCAALVFLCCLPLVGEAAEKNNIMPPSSAKIYREPSEQSVVVANLIRGNSYRVLGESNDETGTLWYKVRTDFGVEGYAKAAELEKVSSKATQNNQNNIETKEDTTDEGSLENKTEDNVLESKTEDNALENKTEDNALETIAKDDALEKITETGVPENNTKEATSENVSDEDVQEGGDNVPGEIITLAALNLRETPSKNAKLVGKAKKNVTMPYFEKYTNNVGEIWYRVTYDGISGYVFAPAVKVVQGVQSANKETENTVDGSSEIKTADDGVTQEDNPEQEKNQSETEILPSATENGKIGSDEVPRTETDVLGETDWMMVSLVAAGLICMAIICVLLIKMKKQQRQWKNWIGEDDASNNPKQTK